MKDFYIDFILKREKKTSTQPFLILILISFRLTQKCSALSTYTCIKYEPSKHLGCFITICFCFARLCEKKMFFQMINICVEQNQKSTDFQTMTTTLKNE